MNTYAELVQAILVVLPNATFGEDNEGQLVIYTGLVEVAPNELSPFTSTDEEGTDQ